jgi:hypothetical protein
LLFLTVRIWSMPKNQEYADRDERKRRVHCERPVLEWKEQCRCHDEETDDKSKDSRLAAEQCSLSGGARRQDCGRSIVATIVI